MGRKSGLYAPLGEKLKEYRKQGYKEVRMTFKQIDKLLEKSHHQLPDSAYEHRAWWSNSETSRQAQEGWLGADYEVDVLFKDEKNKYFRVAFKIKKATNQKPDDSETSSKYPEEKRSLFGLFSDADNDDTLTAQGEDEVKECLRCHETINKNFVFCPYCGQRQIISQCPFCGTTLQKDFNFCPKCGKSRDDMEKA